MSYAMTRQWPWGKIALAAAFLLALTAVWKFFPLDDWAKALLDNLRQMGGWGYVAFFGIYIVAALVGIPRTPLNVGAGILFSFVGALAVVVLASAACNVLTFQIARHVARDWVEKRVKRVPNAEKIMRAVEREGFKLVLLLRLNPFVPAVVKGYGFGTTNLRFSTYLVASILGSLPILAAHVYLGMLGGEAMMSSAEQPPQWRMALMVGGGIISVILVALISYYANRSLHNKHMEAA